MFRLKKTHIRDIALMAMLSAILLAVQVVLGFLPNIELVSLLVILYTLVFGYRTLGIIYVFALLEGVVYGFGLWWVNYLYIWTVLFFAVRLIMRLRLNNFVLWSVVSGFYGLMFGALCSIPYLFIGGTSMMFSYWLNGIPFDLMHCGGNFIACLVLFKPMYAVLQILEHKVYSEKRI